MRGFNDFCCYCTANNYKEIKECDDRNCPFNRDRFANLDYQDNINETNVSS